jgi:hypothetical protein
MKYMRPMTVISGLRSPDYDRVVSGVADERTAIDPRHLAQLGPINLEGPHPAL